MAKAIHGRVARLEKRLGVRQRGESLSDPEMLGTLFETLAFLADDDGLPDVAAELKVLEAAARDGKTFAQALELAGLQTVRWVRDMERQLAARVVPGQSAGPTP